MGAEAGTALLEPVPSSLSLQDMEISVRELQTILNRIISKREGPQHLLPPHVLPLAAFKCQNPGCCPTLRGAPPLDLWLVDPPPPL